MDAELIHTLLPATYAAWAPEAAILPDHVVAPRSSPVSPPGDALSRMGEFDLPDHDPARADPGPETLGGADPAGPDAPAPGAQ